MPNPYYDPGEMGLTKIAEIEYSDMDYEFDTRVVWMHTNGALYTARDSGCSCPTPFEDYTTLESLDVVTDMVALTQEVNEWDAETTPEQRQDFLRAVEIALKPHG